MTYRIGDIQYLRRSESNSSLIVIPKEGQTPLPETQQMIDNRSYQLSERNGAKAYIIPMDKEQVHLNFIPQKTFITDGDIQRILQPMFEYFVDEVIPAPETFTLADGIIFRCVDETSTPKNKEDYTYYIQVGGEAKRIPNYKTLEVMLAERGQNLLSVRVLEKTLCDQIPKSSTEIVDKSSAWSQKYADQTSLEVFRELENNAMAASAIAESAKAEAQTQIDAVKSQAEAANSAAQASAAQASAAKASADAAKKKAEADQAAAAAAKAEAEAAKAEAELARVIAENGG